LAICHFCITALEVLVQYQQEKISYPAIQRNFTPELWNRMKRLNIALKLVSDEKMRVKAPYLTPTEE